MERALLARACTNTQPAEQACGWARSGWELNLQRVRHACPGNQCHASATAHESAGSTPAPLVQAAASGVRGFASKGDADHDEVCLCQEERRRQFCVHLETKCFKSEASMGGCCTLEIT